MRNSRVDRTKGRITELKGSRSTENMQFEGESERPETKQTNLKSIRNT